jgi:hypothetical protein
MNAHNPLTADQANAVYDVLVQHAGASDHQGTFARGHFVATETEECVREYRFMGALGGGGKFRRDYRGGVRDCWYVSCYPEDLTPARQAAVDATNAALAELHP